RGHDQLRVRGSGCNHDRRLHGLEMKPSGGTVRALGLCLLLLASAAQAVDVTDTLEVAWESSWHQSGYLQGVRKWNGPIRVRFSGATAARHREFALQQLKEVSAASGVPVSEAASDDAAANLEVEFMSGRDSFPTTEPCVTHTTFNAFTIQRAKIRAND